MKEKLKKTAKYFVFILIVGIVGGLAYAVFAYIRVYFSPHARGYRTLISESKKSAQLWQSDDVGGETPEETIEFLRQALEKKDFDLASKFFVPDLVSEWRENFEYGDKKGTLEILVRDLGRDTTGTEHMPGRYIIVTNLQDGGAPLLYILVLNEHTGKWKILEL